MFSDRVVYGLHLTESQWWSYFRQPTS